MTPELDKLLDEDAAEIVKLVRSALPPWLRVAFPTEKATQLAVFGVHNLIAELTKSRHLQITAPNVRVIVS